MQLVITYFLCFLTSATVAISADVAFVASPTNTSVKVGQIFTLKCEINKNVSCIWKQNGHFLALSSHERISYLYPEREDMYSVKINASIRDEGKWECSCLDFSTGNLISATAWITVLGNSVDGRQIQRDFLTQPKNVSVELEESFVLECKPVKNVVCHWTQNQRRKIIGPSIVQSKQENDYTVYILSAAEDDQGIWQCKCHSSLNGSTILSDAVSVDVRPSRKQDANFSTESSSSSFTTEMLSPVGNTDVLVNIGDNFILDCGSVDYIVCLWSHNGKKLQLLAHSRQSYIMRNSSDWSIRIRDVEENDQGFWKCTCQEKYPSGIITSKVTRVIVRPTKAGNSTQLTITMHPQHVIVREGGSFTLRCAFSHNVRCMWKHIATPWLVMRTELLHQFRQCTLSIEKASSRDEGLWSCIGTNVTNPSNHIESDIVMVLVVAPSTPASKDDVEDSSQQQQQQQQSSTENSSSQGLQITTTMLTKLPDTCHSCSSAVLIVLSVIVLFLACTTAGLLTVIYLKRKILFDYCTKSQDTIRWNARLISSETEDIS